MTGSRDFTRLGRTGPSVARIGFGGCPMGGHGWGKVEDDELVRAVRDAIASGITLFDTADVYGLGHSEELLARGLNGFREDAVIATKGGVRIDRHGATYYDNSAGWIEEAVHASLRRLRVSTIDLYQIHYWDNVTPLSDTFGLLERLREQGKIRHFGVSNIDLAAHGYHTPVEGLVSISFEYSMARRDLHRVIDRSVAQTAATFLAWGSLGQGVLSGKYDRATRFGSNDRRSRDVYVNFHGERLERNIQIVEALRELTNVYKGRTISNLALRWVLDEMPESVALVGMKSNEQVRDNIAALGWQLEREHLDLLSELADPLPIESEMER